MLKLKLQYFVHLMRRADSLEKTLLMGKIEGRGEEDERGWDGWMGSLTQLTWKWSLVRLFVTSWTAAHQAPPSMGFSRQEYWSGLPFPSPGDLPDPGIEPRSPALQADALTSEPPGKPWTWVWANSWRLWSTGKPGMLQSMGLQRVGHNWATEQQQPP